MVGCVVWVDETARERDGLRKSQRSNGREWRDTEREKKSSRRRSFALPPPPATHPFSKPPMRCTAQSKPASTARASGRAPAAARTPTAAARKATHAVVPLAGLLAAAPAAHAGEDAVDSGISGVIEVVKVRLSGGRAG